MKTFGLTGGIASGKTTVANLLQAAHIPVIDADQAARAVVAPGTPGLREIVEAFGEQILAPDGGLDRTRLGRRIFSDLEARQRLNEIVHPKVRRWMAERAEVQARAGTPLLFMDIPLLYEARDPEDFEGIVVVYVDLQTQLERLKRRNHLSEAEARLRIEAQLPLEDKRARADHVIDNRGTLEETRGQVLQLLEVLLADVRREVSRDHR